jgi:hypothetical protein
VDEPKMLTDDERATIRHAWTRGRGAKAVITNPDVRALLDDGTACRGRIAELEAALVSIFGQSGTN